MESSTAVTPGRASRTGRIRIMAALATVLAAAMLAGVLAVAASRAAEAAFPGRAGKIVFSSARNTDSKNLYAISPDGDSIRRLTTFPTGDSITPVISPDGSRIAFIYANQIWTMGIGGMKANGTGATQVTGTSTAKYDPTWSPDGTRLAYTASSFDVDGQTDLEIWSVNLDGSGRKQLTDNTRKDWQPAWSPDGERIAFVNDTLKDIFVMNSDGSGTETNLTPNSSTGCSPNCYGGLDNHPAWSPDGDWIAYTNNGNGDPDIFKMDARDGDPKMNLTGEQTVGTGGNPGDDTEPAWSPEGDEIAYIATEAGTDRNLYVMDANLPNSGTPINMNPADDESPDWQPNPPTCDRKGNASANRITGDPATAEVICGMGGNDILTGQEGDILLGGDGNDTLKAVSGRATLIGGKGTDTASFAGSDEKIRASLTQGFARRIGTSPLEGVALLSVENLTGSGLADDLTGNGGANKLVGGKGADELLGLSGKDTLKSRDGVNRNDTVGGGAGTDRCITDDREASITGCE